MHNSDANPPESTWKRVEVIEAFCVTPTYCSGISDVVVIGEVIHLIGYVEQPSVDGVGSPEKVASARLIIPLKEIAALLPAIASRLPPAMAETALPGFQPADYRLQSLDVQGYS